MGDSMVNNIMSKIHKELTLRRSDLMKSVVEGHLGRDIEECDYRNIKVVSQISEPEKEYLTYNGVTLGCFETNITYQDYSIKANVQFTPSNP